jgi:hypothetical protein
MDSFERHPLRTVIACVAALLVMWLICASLFFGLRVATAGIVGRGNAHVKLQSANYRIAAYDHFFNVCASVQSAEGSLDAQFDLLSTLEGGDDKSITNTNIAALKSVRMGAINQYNADAQKDYTLGQFKDSGLPYQLPTTSYDKKGDPKTSCTI